MSIHTDEHDDIQVLTGYHRNYINRKWSLIQRDMAEGAYANEVIEAMQKILDKLKEDRV